MGEDIERMIEGRIIEDCESHLVGDFDSGSCTPPAALSATQSVDTLSIALLKALSDFTSSQAEGKVSERYSEKESESVETITESAVVTVGVADAAIGADADAGDLIVIKSNSSVAVGGKVAALINLPLKGQKDLKSLEPPITSDSVKESIILSEQAEPQVDVSADLLKSKSTTDVNENVIVKRYTLIFSIC